MKDNLKEDNTKAEEVSLKVVLLRFQRYSKFLLSNWFVIILLVILGGFFGWAYSKIKTPLYVSTTTFVLEESDKAGGLGQYAGIASMVGVDIGGAGSSGIFQGDNIIELYKSRKMIQNALLTEITYNGRKELLIDRYIDFNNLRNVWDKNLALKNVNFSNPRMLTRLQDSIIGTIVVQINKKYLNVSKPDKKLSIIKAEVKAEDEFFAKEFNYQIVKKVNDFYIQTKTKKSSRNIQILQEKTDSVRAVMNGAIYASVAIDDKTPNLNPTRQTQRVAPMQKSQFNAETNKEVLTELVKNLELSKISLIKETPLIQVIDEPILPLKKEDVGPLAGIILGGLFFGILTIIVISVRKFIISITSE